MIRSILDREELLLLREWEELVRFSLWGGKRERYKQGEEKAGRGRWHEWDHRKRKGKSNIRQGSAITRQGTGGRKGSDISRRKRRQ